MENCLWANFNLLKCLPLSFTFSTLAHNFTVWPCTKPFLPWPRSLHNGWLGQQWRNAISPGSQWFSPLVRLLLGAYWLDWKKTLNDFPAKSPFPVVKRGFNICEQKQTEGKWFLYSLVLILQKQTPTEKSMKTDTAKYHWLISENWNFYFFRSEVDQIYPEQFMSD